MYKDTCRQGIYQPYNLPQFPDCGKLIDIEPYPATVCTSPA